MRRRRIRLTGRINTRIDTGIRLRRHIKNGRDPLAPSQRYAVADIRVTTGVLTTPHGVYTGVPQHHPTFRTPHFTPVLIRPHPGHSGRFGSGCMRVALRRITDRQSTVRGQ